MAHWKWTCLVLVLVLEIGCKSRRRGMSYDTPAALPESTRGEVLDISGWLIIHLTKEGDLRLGEQPVSLAMLDKALVQEEHQCTPECPPEHKSVWAYAGIVSERRVLVCADRAAPYLHLAWLFDRLRRHGLIHVSLGVRTEGAKAVLATPLDSTYMDQDVTDFEAVNALPWSRVTIEPANTDGFTFYLRDRSTNDREQLATWIRADVVRAREAAGIDPLIGLCIDRRIPLQEVVATFDALRGADAKHVDWPMEGAPSPIDTMRQLPRPRRGFLVEEPGYAYDLTDILLPIASEGVPDKDDDPDDRLILNLDAYGRIPFKGKPRSLDELGTVLYQARRVYNLKQKAKGRRGEVEVAPGIEATKLFVLLRADREALWQHVLWVMAILRERRFFKLQLAVVQSADLRYTPEEAMRVGATPRDWLPPPPHAVEAKLSLPIRVARAGGGPAGSRVLVRVVGLRPELRPWGESGESVPVPSAASYRIGDVATEEVRELGRLVLALGGQASCTVDADETVPYKFVVAAINQLRSAGIGRIDFVWPPTPSPSLRRKPCLPHPETGAMAFLADEFDEIIEVEEVEEGDDPDAR